MSNDGPEFDFTSGAFAAKSTQRRLKGQMKRILDLMSDHRWRTLSRIHDKTGAPEASASSSLRTLRSYGYTVDRKYVGGGLHKYKLSGEPDE